MSSKSGENLNDEVNQTVETSVNAGMNEQDVASLDKIGKLQDEQFQRSGMTVPSGTEVFRLQLGSHGGSSVFFNRNGEDCRYSLSDGENGSMYVAQTPDTAMKEVFQHKCQHQDLWPFFAIFNVRYLITSAVRFPPFHHH